eukprot:COSAG02_NODE_1498_length_12281_cov_14.846741_14_plen_236_part_00
MSFVRRDSFQVFVNKTASFPHSSTTLLCDSLTRFDPHFPLGGAWLAVRAGLKRLGMWVASHSRRSASCGWVASLHRDAAEATGSVGVFHDFDESLVAPFLRNTHFFGRNPYTFCTLPHFDGSWQGAYMSREISVFKPRLGRAFEPSEKFFLWRTMAPVIGNQTQLENPCQSKCSMNAWRSISSPTRCGCENKDGECSGLPFAECGARSFPKLRSHILMFCIPGTAGSYTNPTRGG